MAITLKLPTRSGALEDYTLRGTAPVQPAKGAKFNRIAYSAAHVVADPLERGNLKTRRPEDFSRLQSAWTTWNATMLPERTDSFSETYTGSQLADHFGASEAPTLPRPAMAGEAPR